MPTNKTRDSRGKPVAKPGKKKKVVKKPMMGY